MIKGNVVDKCELYKQRPHVFADKETRPLITIGVPVFNGESYLAQAINSLLEQTVSNFELIISDNASTDKTEAICQEFRAQDARVRYYRQEFNIGGPRNWNFVAKKARGKYFKWASANDFCDPNMLSLCVEVMESEPNVVLCHGRTCLVSEETDRKELYKGDVALIEALPHERIRKLLCELSLNNAQSGLIRLDALRRTRFDRIYPGGDKALMVELALQGLFILLPQILLYRRIGEKTFSSRLSPGEIKTFFGGKSNTKMNFQLLRLHMDLFESVLLATLSIPEKLRTLSIVVRHTCWDRENLWVELRKGITGAIG